eukprot:3339052-Prymnesium_polylepis.1
MAEGRGRVRVRVRTGGRGSGLAVRILERACPRRQTVGAGAEVRGSGLAVWGLLERVPALAGSAARSHCGCRAGANSPSGPPAA